jgi:hypothetical protein
MEFISIGSKCITALNLKNTGFRKAAYPFDWLFCSLTMVQHCIATNFVYFLDKKFIVPVLENTSDHAFYKRYLQSRKENDEAISVFNHHNLCSEDVYQAFTRRCHRFMKRFCDKTQRVCMVYTIQRDLTSQIWPSDLSDPEWSDICSFVDFLKNQNAHHVIVLTFVLQRVESQGDKVPQFQRIYDTDNHQAFIVYYDLFDNLNDVKEILENVVHLEKNDNNL